MIVISRNVSIPDNELEITAIRAQGAGGQHVNKTSTAIHLRFDIRASSLPEYYKERLLAWIKYADERLQFTRGLSAEDEPEAWLRNDHLGIDLWIELGLPDERRIKKACTQSGEVALFAYNSRAAQIWWQQNQNKCAQFKNLTVWYLDDEQLAQLSDFAGRTMALQATIQDGAIWLSDSQNNLEIHLTAWQPRS